MQLRFYCPPDEPTVTECCGATFFGDYIVGELCPSCGKELPIPDDNTDGQDHDMTLQTIMAVRLLGLGWTVEYSDHFDLIRWRSPKGISGSDFFTRSLDEPPMAAVRMCAQDLEDINRVQGT